VVVFSLVGLPHWFPLSRIHSLSLDIQRTVQFTQGAVLHTSIDNWPLISDVRNSYIMNVGCIFVNVKLQTLVTLCEANQN